MSNQKLGILAVVAVVLVIFAAMQSRQSTPSESNKDVITYLIQGLEPANVYSVKVKTGDSEVTLIREGNGFLVHDLSDYPADVKRVNELFTDCLDIKTQELYSSNAANHGDLEVSEDQAKHIIKFYDANDTLMTGVVVGKERDEGKGQYVRLADTNDVYVTDWLPYFSARPIEYTNQELAAVKKEDVESIQLTSPAGSFELTSDDDGQVQLGNLPAGKKLKTSDAKNVFNVLSSLRFDNVLKKAPEGVSFDNTFVCKLKSGIVYGFSLGKKDDKTYLTCQADYVGGNVMLDPKKKDSEEELKAKEAKLLAQENATKFTESHKGWVYEIPSWKSRNMLKSKDELLEDAPAPAVPAPKTEEPAAATEAPQPAPIGPALPPVTADPNR